MPGSKNLLTAPVLNERLGIRYGVGDVLFLCGVHNVAGPIG